MAINIIICMSSHAVRCDPSISWLLNLSEDFASKPKPEEINQSPIMMEEEVKNPENLMHSSSHQIETGDKSLALQNLNSLAILFRQSTERGMPIPRNMLSNSEDAFQPQAEQYHQNEPVLKEEFPEQDLEGNFGDLGADDARMLLDSLGLQQLIPIKKDNTKNVLRNFGNAQNQYVLYNKSARRAIESELHDPSKFDAWVRALKLENFENFKKVWEGGSCRPFIRLYKSLCWTFYADHAIPYVLSSRIRNCKTRSSHLKYIYRFLQGIRDPNSFNYFKKPEK